MFPIQKNAFIYDESAVGHEELFIMESAADAASANQAGIPAIFFDLNMDPGSHKKLIEVGRRSKRIYILGAMGDQKRIAGIGNLLAMEGLLT